MTNDDLDRQDLDRQDLDRQDLDRQDIAEQLDEDATGTDPDDPEQIGLLDVAPDDPLAVDEALVTEPIVDSVASRDDRLQPDEWDGSHVDDEPVTVAPEEAAMHVIDDTELG